ncbi:glutamate receptor 2.7-like [Humulus lupulus]|uniref:glutamate receptor 2.7-like n=1 Tax=Humulus lupulus TaxID=3486 RepID=UPI002B4071F9|nr:glutamate receptor 2.7-like [Humulus lupulus]
MKSNSRVVDFGLCSNLRLLVMLLVVIMFEQKSIRCDDNRAVVMGAIVDESSRVGKEEKIAITMAVKDIHIKNSQRDPMKAALAARHLITKKRVEAILMGSHSWEDTSLVAKVGNEYHIPILSLTDPNLIPKWATQMWPSLVQFSPNNNLNQMKAIAAIVRSWEWYQVTLIYEENSMSINDVLPHLSSSLQEVGAKISQLVSLPPFFSSSSMTDQLERLKENQSKVFVVHSSVEFALKLFDKAREMKMVEMEYVWITTDSITSFVHSFNASTFSSMQGVLGLKSYFREEDDDEPHWQHFYHKFRKRFSSEYPKEYSHEPGMFATQAYDAARAMALAVTKKAFSNSGHKDRQEVLGQILKSDHFHGLSSSNQHIFQIINVFGKSYRELGFWSDEFGFSKTIEGGNNKSSLKDLGQVMFWPGGDWKTPKGWTTPTISNPLKIGVPNTSLFDKFLNVKMGEEHSLDSTKIFNNVSFSGFVIDVFEEIVDKLSFSLPYTLIPFNDTYDKLVEKIYLKEFDAVVGDVSIVADRYKHAEFTLPYTQTGLVMIVPVRSKTSNRAWLFLKPFTMSMWLFIVIVNIYNGFVVWLIERNYCPQLKDSPILDQIGTLFWLAFSTLFSLHGDKLHSNLSRMTMLVWLFVALVITQTYTANLTSMLTVQQLEPDIGALHSSKAVFGYCRGSYLQRYLVDVLKLHPNQIKNFTTQDQYAEALRIKQVAGVFLELPLAKLFLAKHCKGFTMIEPTYKVGGFGFAFPKESPLLPSINKALLEVSEKGKLLELEKTMLESENCTCIRKEYGNDDDEPPSLSLKSFWVLFVFTIATSTIALVIYIFYLCKSMFKLQAVWYWLMMKSTTNQRARLVHPFV